MCKMYINFNTVISKLTVQKAIRANINFNQNLELANNRFITILPIFLF